MKKSRAVLAFGFFSILIASGVLEAREFSNRQFWNTPAIRYRDSKAECLESTKGWATDGVRHECKVAFNHAPAYVKLCEAAEVEISETEYTDRYGTECSTRATINVK